MNIKYEISNFMTLDEFEKYVNDNIIPTLNSFENEDKEGWIKYFLLIMTHGKFEELIPCNIYTFKDLQLRPIEDRESDYPNIYNINEMKCAMMYEWGDGVEYYVALAENERIIKDA